MMYADVVMEKAENKHQVNIREKLENILLKQKDKRGIKKGLRFKC